ncbi:MAG: ABC transporter permease [Planctomycetes bacterium]|nr:ABC transporter permease [Planctomycetota bacterium]
MSGSVAAVGPTPGAGFLPALSAPFRVALRHRELILRMTRREIEMRYRGSALGLFWSLITPLLMLGVYTFVFGHVFGSRWSGEGADTPFALLLFSGLIVYGVLADPVNRAPGLMFENVSYIKKVVFPLDALSWMVLFSTLFTATVNLIIWVLFHLVAVGMPPWTAVLLPLVLLPLCLMALGLTWFLAAMGVFVRDLRQAVPVVTTILMFTSPIFYPLTAVPERIRGLMHLNPLATILGQSKEVLVIGRIPDWRAWLVLMAVSWIVFALGHLWFQRARRGFADVL